MPRSFKPRTTTVLPDTVKQGLMPYAIRKCTEKEMLYGGIRIQHLVQSAPKLTKHISEKIKIPTPGMEISMLQLEYNHIPIRMMPINVGHQHKFEMSILRNQDVYNRFLKQNRAHAAAANAVNGANIKPIGVTAPSEEFDPATGKHSPSASPAAVTSLEARQLALRGSDRKMYHVKRSQLSIHGADVVGTKEAVNESQVQPIIRTTGSEVFGVGGGAFMPFQMVKPVQHSFSPAARTSGLTSPAGRLKQELQDRKGFGWQKKQRGLWNQDIATRGYKPDKFY